MACGNFRSTLRPATTIATALAALLGATHAAAQAPSPAQISAQLGDQLAVDDKCKVLDPDQRRAMELFSLEIRSLLAPADQAAVDTWLRDLRSNLAAVPCTDPRLVASAKGMQATAADRQALWAARVQAVANLRGNTLWASMGDMAGLKRTAADRSLADLATRNPAAAQQLKSLAATEAGRALGILCPSMSRNAAKCPALPTAPNEAETAFARRWLDRVEQYASYLPGARADGQPVLPKGVRDWSEVFNTTTAEMALAGFNVDTPCDASAYVVRPDGPMPLDITQTTPATIFSARDGFEVGRGEITLFGTIPVLKGQWVDSLKAEPMGLVRCKANP